MSWPSGPCWINCCSSSAVRAANSSASMSTAADARRYPPIMPMTWPRLPAAHHPAHAELTGSRSRPGCCVDADRPVSRVLRLDDNHAVPLSRVRHSEAQVRDGHRRSCLRAKLCRSQTRTPAVCSMRLEKTQELACSLPPALKLSPEAARS
jgi:hypothetical protein